MMNRGRWVVWALLCVLPLHSSDAVNIDMYQIHKGRRAIGANITIVSTVSPEPTEGTVTIVFRTTSNGMTTQAASVFISNWNDDSSDRLNLLNFPIDHLNISQSVSNEQTRNFEWYFRYLPAHYDELVLETMDNSDHNKLNSSILVVEACESHNISTKVQDSWIRIESTQDGHYHDDADCSCFKPEEKLFTVQGTKAVGTKASCGYNAEWVGCENLQCWSAPSDITAVQLYTTAGAKSPFDCNYTQGFPNVSDKIFKIDNFNVSENHVLASHDHGKKLSCQVISDFTKKNGSLYLSSPTDILVHYPPESSTLSSAILVMDLNDSKLFNYSVNANPSNGSVDITFKNELDHDVSYKFNVFHNYTKENSTLHSYEFNFNLTSDQEYGNYNVCASTIIPNGTDCSTLSIRNAATSTPSLPDTATSSVATGSKNIVGPGLPAPIIGAIVAGVIAIMLIAVGIVIHKKRKQSSSKDNVREETVNVLYGSAQYQTSSAENQENVKHEKSNVLYESASGSAGGDLVEYATANPDGIESDVAVQYATSNADVENTGAVASASSAAEPSCSGNTSVYAQINKKKGKVNDGYKIEMHDTSEATYTVVDKSNKRNKDNVPEVYAVVNKPRAKD